MRTHAGSRAARPGYSLMEIAMVLAIIALLIAGIMLYFQNASDGQKTLDLASEISAVNVAVNSLYAGQPDYTGLSSQVVSGSKLLPSKWIATDNSSLKNAFGGFVSVDSNPGLAGLYSVVVTGISPAACSKLLSMDWGSTLAFSAGTNGVAVQGRPQTPEEANQACGSVSGTQVVEFYFGTFSSTGL